MAENINTNYTDKTNPTAAAKTLLYEAWAANLDPQTTQQLSGLTNVRQARINQQQRELATLSAQYGATDAAVVALKSSIAVQQSVTSVLGTARDLAKIKLPTVSKSGWVLQGHVRDGKLQPISGLTVCLADQQKNFLSTYGYAYTDANGYYSLNYTPTGSSAAPLGAYLEVLNSSRQPIYIDSAPFTLSPGATVTRDLVLTSHSPLGTPPSGKG